MRIGGCCAVREESAAFVTSFGLIDENAGTDILRWKPQVEKLLVQGIVFIADSLGLLLPLFLCLPGRLDLTDEHMRENVLFACYVSPSEGTCKNQDEGTDEAQYCIPVRSHFLNKVHRWHIKMIAGCSV